MSPQNSFDDNDSVISALIDLAPQLASSAEQVLGPISANSDTLRARLLDDGMIRAVDLDSSVAPESMCAIDGARITENLYGADMLVAVATLVNGISARSTLMPLSLAWADMVPHVPEVDWIAGTAMGILETKIAAQAPHEYRLLDGSFLTPTVPCTQGLTTRTAEVRNRVTDLIVSNGMPDALESVLTPDLDRPVLALPKSEVSKHYVARFNRDYGLMLNVPDRILAAQVLEPGEVLAPRPLQEWGEVRPRSYSEASRAAIDAAQALEDACAGMKVAVAEGRAVTFYVKPFGSRDTVIRCEFVSPDADLVQPLTLKYAAVLLGETRAPHALEPFAQWAVDRQAKGISKGSQALRAKVLSGLTPEQREAWGWQIAQRYRT